MVAAGNHSNRAELRKKPRREFHYNAGILTDPDAAPRRCAIADISESGARLVVDKNCELPERFILLLTPSGGARRHCRLVWRDGEIAGVAFPPPPQS